jgi:methionyl-tRNA formyltransferase
MKHGRFEFADRLLENYNANPDADDNAALENSLVDKKSNNVEYLADRGADMSKALPYIRDKKLGTSNFREKLSDIFAKRSVAKPLIDWYKEDDTTLVREHRTANLIHQTIFFFGEGEVALSVCNIKTSAQLNHKILSFAQFHNRELIKQAAQKLKGLKGDPGPENLPKAIQQIKTPHAMQKPLKPDS